MNHIPALKDELIDYLDLKAGLTVVDMTLGLGGHAAAVLEKIGETGRLIGLDLDRDNLRIAEERLKKYQKQIFLYHRRFDYVEGCLEKAGFDKVDRIYFDLGLSSPHVDQAARGFSFSAEGPLDMRFDRSDKRLQTAVEIVNTWSEQELMEIFWKYGEENQGRRLAKAIVAGRKKKLIKTTQELKEIILSVIHWHRHKSHPATKIFQALRIAVNDELKVLERALRTAFNCLTIGGRLAVISYHSLEDRMVKNFFRELEKNCVCPKELPICQCHKRREIKILTKKPIGPGEPEVERNPRSRSGKLRIGEKIL